MTDTEIIEELRRKLSFSAGRHLYGILGPYQALDRFVANLQQARMPNDQRFPRPVSVNKGIMECIPDEEFKQLVEDEPRRPEPAAVHIRNAFERFIRQQLKKKDLIVLANLELVFSYNLELSLLRTLAADDSRILLLLPGKRVGDRIVMFPESVDGNFTLPPTLIADNHLWELAKSSPL